MTQQVAEHLAAGEAVQEPREGDLDRETSALPDIVGAEA